MSDLLKTNSCIFWFKKQTETENWVLKINRAKVRFFDGENIYLIRIPKDQILDKAKRKKRDIQRNKTTSFKYLMNLDLQFVAFVSGLFYPCKMYWDII